MDAKNHSRVLEKFTDYARSLTNPSVEAFKGKGGNVIGYFCSFIPEEIFMAADLMPFRIRGTGSVSTERADEYFTSWNCSFPRHCFSLALLGKYDFLDGVVIGASCDTIRHVYENWKHSPLKTPFIYLLNAPHVSGEVMADYFRKELVKLKTAIEGHFGVIITDEKLWDAIKLSNETRTLQQKIYDLRKSPAPPITGSEMVAVMTSGVSMPKAEYHADLKQLLNELESMPADNTQYSARLMLVGSGGDDTIICEIAKELGAIIVTDHTCFGGKIKYRGVAETGGDPYDAMAKYQILDRPFCPKIGGGYPLRAGVIIETARRFQADGIIGQRLGCCDVWGGELFTLREELRDAGIPSLILEREYVSDSEGQLATRIQAFIEMIGR